MNGMGVRRQYNDYMNKVEADLKVDTKIQIFYVFNVLLMNFLFPRKSLYNEYKLENIISRLRTV